jgi:hypothetical protein
VGTKTRKQANRDAFDVTTLPLLSSRRVCIVADCHPATLARSPLRPVGKRGRVKFYRTSDVMAWISGQLGASDDTDVPTAPMPRSSTSSADALARIHAVRVGSRP